MAEDRPTTKELEHRRADLRRELADLKKVSFRPKAIRLLIARARVKARKEIARLSDRIRARKERVKPQIVYTKNSPNQSSRTGAPIQLIVIHDTESHEQQGNGDLVGIANYFASTAAQASSHVITDGDGHSARCVPDAAKAWTQAFFNPWCLSIEQIGFASYDREDWTDAQVDETARWCALWSKQRGVPLQRGAVSGQTITIPGIVSHEQLGSAGGGHHDPGDSYPFGRLLERAQHFRARL